MPARGKIMRGTKHSNHPYPVVMAPFHRWRRPSTPMPTCFAVKAYDPGSIIGAMFVMLGLRLRRLGEERPSHVRRLPPQVAGLGNHATR